MAVAFRIPRDADRAEDAVQRRRSSPPGDLPAPRPGPIRWWLYRILVNACYVEARKSRRWNANIRLLTPDIGSLVRRAAVRRGPRRAGTGLRRLPAEQRAVFVLHHYTGMRLADIGEALDIPVGTVKSRLHYATASLRAAIEAMPGRRRPHEGATRMTDRTFDRIADDLSSARRPPRSRARRCRGGARTRRRDRRAPRRFPTMNSYAKVRWRPWRSSPSASSA